MFPDAVRGQARRVHGAGRAVRLPGRLLAQLLADRDHCGAEHRRLVRVGPLVRAREPCVAGVPGQNRRRRVLQAQVETGHHRHRCRCRCHSRPVVLQARQPIGRLPAVLGALSAPGTPTAVRAAGDRLIRRPAGGRLGDSRAQLVLHSRRAGRVPRDRQFRVFRHGPSGVHHHTVVHRHTGGQPRDRRVQSGPPAVPQPPGFTAVELHTANGIDNVHHVQQRRVGAQLAREEHARRARRPRVQLRGRLFGHQELSVRARVPGLVGVCVFRRRSRFERCLRRADVLRTQIVQPFRSRHTFVRRTGGIMSLATCVTVCDDHFVVYTPQLGELFM